MVYFLKVFAEIIVMGQLQRRQKEMIKEESVLQNLSHLWNTVFDFPISS